MNRTGDDFMELVCENGQILVRGRSGTISCISYLSHSPKTQFNNGIKDNHPPKRPRLVHVDSISGDESFPGHKEPTKEDSFLQDNHHTNEKCQKWPRTSFSIFLENMRRSPCDQIAEPRIVPLHKTKNLQSGNTPDFVAVPRLSAVWSRQKHETTPEQQRSSSKLRQTQMSKIGNLPNDSKLHQPDSKHHDKHSDLQPSSSLRPVALLSSHDQPSGSSGPRLPRPELETTNEKPPVGCSNPVQSTTNERTSHLRISKSKMELPPDEQSEAVFPRDVITRKQCPSAAFVPASGMAVDRVQAKPGLVKNTDHMAAANSTCSRGASTDPTYSLKCKRGDIEVPAYPSEDDEEEIEGEKKSEAWGSRSAKRKSREIHNLSEKRRRDKINKRIHALQDLLPGSSKVGKASVLDETIEYVKTLQLQLQLQFQMMSMGTGIFMSPAMFPSGMQSMQAPYLAQMSAMAIRMHMGFGCRPTSLVSSSPVFGLSGQRMPIPVPQPPFFPSIGRASTHSIPVPAIPGIASLPSSSLKGSVQIGSSGVVHNGIVVDPIIQVLHQGIDEIHKV